MKRIIMAGVALALGLGLTACSQDEGLSDAPVGIVDDAPTFVITNNDKFPNMSMKCYEGALLITTTRDYNALTVVPEFAACADGDPVPASRK